MATTPPRPDRNAEWRAAREVAIAQMRAERLALQAERQAAWAAAADRRRDAHERGRRRTALSLDAIVNGAVALLDEAGESALTFRALAQRLGGGVGSIYWYVASKDELLDRATDRVLDDVVDDSRSLPADADPIDNIRAIAWALFDVVVARPWLGAYFMRETSTQPNSLELYELLGQQALRLGLTPRQTFHAVSAVTGFVIGTATDLGQAPPQAFIDSGLDRDSFLAQVADQWRALDPQQFPFLHTIVDEFAVHDDVDQFRAGLDLLLAGLRLQTEG